jgi:hypothetical protein
MDNIKAKQLNEFAKKLIQHDDALCRMKDSWGRVWVEAEQPIPEKLRSDFYDELTSDNLVYRKELEESVRWFGVRWL